MICIQCPMGCPLQVEKRGDTYVVSGNQCKRGKEYGISEMTAPKRIITCLVKVEGTNDILSVKTNQGVPKDMVFDCIAAIKKQKWSAPIVAGEVLIENLLNTGVCVIATKTV